ncbi:Ig-like domain-containing protein [Arhodomonas sp. AD133]|uniref:Ig-like domain-containing protein n=1 Tax=Arhodomonas sp. AD133 TaxID=3415009 RepID=UPI003EBF8308
MSDAARPKTTTILIAAATLAIAPAAAQAETLHVNANAGGANDGSSWSDAYTALQDAFDEVNANPATDYEIWIAAGTYHPDRDSDGDHTSGDRGERFQLDRDGVAIYGGFAGSESRRSQREVAGNDPVVLSGDLQGDDQDTNGDGVADTNIGDNSSTVIHFDGTSTDITNATIVDGVTITAGDADQDGGGMYCNGTRGGTCNPTLVNVTFTDNRASDGGGAVYNNGGDGTSSPVFVNAVFTDNRAGGAGGAMYNDGGRNNGGVSSPTIVNAAFIGNRAGEHGGAIYNDTYTLFSGGTGHSSPEIVNATFADNVAAAGNGGAMHSHGVWGGTSNPVITNATFTGNRAHPDGRHYGQGGALYNNGGGDGGDSTAVITNTIVYGNSADEGGDEIYYRKTPPTVAHSLIQGGLDGDGVDSAYRNPPPNDGGGNIDGNPDFTDAGDPDGLDDIPGTEDDGLMPQPNAAVLDAGDTSALPADTADLDGDGDTSEPLPVDLTGAARVQEGAVEIGAYEIDELAGQRPTARADTVSTAEDTSLSGNVLADNGAGADDDPNGDALSVTTTPVSPPGSGSVSLSTDGTFDYTPPADFNGRDDFTYEVCDAGGLCDTARVRVSVTAINDPPVASDSGISTDEDTPTGISLQGTDPDGDALDFAVTAAPSAGSLSGNAPEVTYTPDAEFNGNDSFTFETCDPDGLCDTATVAITVAAVDDSPTADAQSVSTPEETPVSVTLTGDSPDNEALTFSVTGSGPAHGTITGNAPALTYVPATGFQGADSFGFQVCDPGGRCGSATVDITVTDANDAPTADARTVSTAEDTELPITLTGSDPDGDALTFSLDGNGPQHGTVTGAPPSLTYTPNAGFDGDDRFTVRAIDTVDATAEARLTVEAQTITTANGEIPTVSVAATAPDNSPLTLSVDGSGPSGGTVTTSGGGALTYTPTADFDGDDRFTVAATDGAGGSPRGSVTVAISAAFSADGISVSVTLTGSTPDAHALAFSAVGAGPSEGSITSTPPALTYTPSPDFNGTDTFGFRVSDGRGATDRATVTVEVDAINDAPDAADDRFTTAEDTSVSGNLLDDNGNGADRDPEGDALTVARVPDTVRTAAASRGSLALNSDGSFTYTPAPDFNGTYAFDYRVCDTRQACTTATAQITVTAVNDAPDAVRRTVATPADTPVALTLAATDPDDDTLAFTLTGSPDHGRLQGTPPALTYIPESGFEGDDRFTFRVSDDSGATARGAVTVAVNGSNQPPVAANDRFTVNPGTAVTGNLLADNQAGRDRDPDGDTLRVATTPVTAPAEGSLTLRADGGFTYTPPAPLDGPVRFVYRVCDPGGLCDTATVTVGTGATADTRKVPALGGWGFAILSLLMGWIAVRFRRNIS